MAILPVNLQSGVDASLSMSQTGLNTRRSASIVLDDKQKRLDAESTKFDIQQKMAAFEEWQSEDAKRARATQQKLAADSLTFMSENQDLIDNGWMSEQAKVISGHVAEMADNESDLLATITSPLMEAKTFEEAQDIYESTVYPQLSKHLPDRVSQGAFSVPEVFSEESWKKSQLANLSAVRNRSQRQQRDLQNNQGRINKELQDSQQEHQVKLALWETYSKSILIDQEYGLKLELEKTKGTPLTLDALGLSEDKLTNWQNSIMPRAVEEIRSIYPNASEDSLTVAAKAVTSDVMQTVRESWNGVALQGHNPTELLGSPDEVFGKLMTERLDPSNGYIVFEKGIMGDKARYRPSGFQGRAAEEEKKARDAVAKRSKTINELRTRLLSDPEFNAMSPKAQERHLDSVYKDIESGVQPRPAPKAAAPRTPTAAERQSEAISRAISPTARVAGDALTSAINTALYPNR